MRINRYNEFDYAERILEKNDFISRFKTYESKVLAKYYKYKGYKPKEIRDLLYDFYRANIVFFREVNYFKKIESIVNFARKKNNKLIIIEDFFIDKKYYDYIMELKIKYDYKKFLFCLLVKHTLNRLVYEQCSGVTSNTTYFSEDPSKQREVFRMCNFKKSLNMNKIIFELYTKEIVDITESGKINMKFLDKLVVDNDSFMARKFITINTWDINEMGHYFDKLNGNMRIKKCKTCNILIKITGTNQRYCKDCGIKNKRAYNAIKQREYRKNKEKLG